MTQPCTSVVLLIVGPDMTLVARRARLFRQIGYCVVVARNGDHAVRLALDSDCDMVLICHRFDDMERESIRRRLKVSCRRVNAITLYESDDADPRRLVAQIARTKPRVGNTISATWFPGAVP